MLGTFFKLVGKAIRFSVSRPLQRFNIYNRAKKYLGEDAKYFAPAPRAIGALSKIGPSRYPHLEGGGYFKSIKQKRLEALQNRHQKTIESHLPDRANSSAQPSATIATAKSFSETRADDNMIIELSNKLPVVKIVTKVENQKNQLDTNNLKKSSSRPLPKLTNLPLQDPASIWVVDKTRPGRLSLEQLQELMINKLADDLYWTPKKISETYNIKEEYAENLIKYLKQIRIIISPRIAKLLDYTARNNPVYQATKHVIYHVDKSLRTETDRQFDNMYLPTDEIDEEIRELINAGAMQARQQPDPSLRALIKRPQPLRLNPINKFPEISSQEFDEQMKPRKKLEAPSDYEKKKN